MLLALVLGTATSSYFAVRATARAEEALTQRNRANSREVEARRQARIAQTRLRLAQRRTYHLQLARAQDLCRDDPGKSLGLLDDREICPAELREFTWGFLHRSAQKKVLRLQSHEGAVKFVAFPPTGGQLVTGGTDGRIRIWDLLIQKPLREIKDLPGNIIDGCLSPDGTRAAVICSDATIRLFKVPDGTDMGTIKGEHGQPLKLAFAPDGVLLAAGGKQPVVELWDVNSRRLQTSLTGPTQPIRALVFGVDGRRLFAGTGETLVSGELVVWDVASQKMLLSLRTRSSVQGIVPLNGLRCVLGDGMGAVLVVAPSADAGVEVQMLNQSAGTICSVASSPQGGLFAASGFHGDVRGAIKHERNVIIWNAQSLQVETYLPGLHDHVPATMAFSPDGRLLATGTENGFVDVWLVGSDRVEAVLECSGPVEEIAFGQQGKTMTVHTKAGEVTEKLALDFATGMPIEELSSQASRVQSQIEDGVVSLTERDTGRLIAKVDGLLAEYSPDGKFVAVVDTTPLIELRDIAKNEGARALPGREVTYSRDGKLLAAISGNDKVSVWALTRDAIVQTFRVGDALSLHSLHFSPDSELLLACDGYRGYPIRKIHAWNIKSGTGRTLNVERNDGAVAISPVGKILAIGTEVGGGGNDDPPADILVYDLQDEREPLRIPGHGGKVSSLAFSRDGKLLLSMGEDQYVKLIETDRWSELAKVKVPSPAGAGFVAGCPTVEG